MMGLDLLGAEDLGAPPRGGMRSESMRRGPSKTFRPPTSTSKPSAPTSAPTPIEAPSGGGGGGGTSLLDTGPPAETTEPITPTAPTVTPTPLPTPTPTSTPSAPAPRQTYSSDRDWYRQQSRERDYYRDYDYPYPQYQYEYPSYYYAPPIVVEQPIYAYSEEPLAEEEQMDTYDLLGADELGYDYSALLKGAAGLLSGVSEGFGDKKAAQPPPPPPPPPASNTWKYVAIGVGGLGVLGLIIVLATRKSG